MRGIYKVPSRRQLWRTLISTNINSQCINIPICQFTNLFNERKIWKSWNKRVGTYSRTQYVNRPFCLSPSSEREPRERKWPRELLGFYVVVFSSFYKLSERGTSRSLCTVWTGNTLDVNSLQSLSLSFKWKGNDNPTKKRRWTCTQDLIV